MGIGLSVVATLSATAGALLAISLSATPLQQSSLTPEEAAVFNNQETISNTDLRLPKLTRPVNILILGTKVLTSDIGRSPEELGYHALVNSFAGLSDTILIARFDPFQEKLTLLSIPRDTRVYLEGYGNIKINAANQLGGAPLAAQAVSTLLGDITIDRYVRVNVQGVEKLIDALGGVTVYVPKDMKYRDDSQHLYINLKEGEQHLNGEQAVQFLRFRYDQYGDIGRVQRQQLLMRAVIEQALNPRTVVRVPKIFSVIQSHLDTNLNIEEILALAGFATASDRSQVQMLLLPGQFNGTGAESVSYWLPDRDRIEQIVARHFDVGASDTHQRELSRIRIAIQDSTNDRAAVRALLATLQAAGYQNVYISQNWREPLSVTRIVAQSGDQGSAAAVRAVLQVGEVRVESTGALNSDVTIQLGRDWLQRQAKLEPHFPSSR